MKYPPREEIQEKISFGNSDNMFQTPENIPES